MAANSGAPLPGVCWCARDYGCRDRTGPAQSSGDSRSSSREHAASGGVSGQSIPRPARCSGRRRDRATRTHRGAPHAATGGFCPGHAAAGSSNPADAAAPGTGSTGAVRAGRGRAQRAAPPAIRGAGGFAAVGNRSRAADGTAASAATARTSRCHGSTASCIRASRPRRRWLAGRRLSRERGGRTCHRTARISSGCRCGAHRAFARCSFWPARRRTPSSRCRSARATATYSRPRSAA